MTVTVMLFAAARDLGGADTIAVDLPSGATVAALRAELARLAPSVAGLLAKSALAVNHDIAENGYVLKPSDEVAIIPPVSGG